MQMGKELLAKGDRQSAILELKNTLQAQPGNAEARFLLGKAHLANGAYAEAEKELHLAKEKGIAEELVVPGLAKALLGKGEYQKVLDLGIPTHTYGALPRAELYVARATAQLATGLQLEGLQSLSSAEQAAPNHPDMLMLKARMAMEGKYQEQALKLLDTALRQDAHHVEALFMKAAILMKGNRQDEALKLFRQVTTENPNHFQAYLAAAELLRNKGDTTAADKSIQSAEKVAGKLPMVKYARGLFELQTGHPDKASTTLAEVLRIIPDHMPSNLAYAMASYGTGNYEQSIKLASKVLGAYPDNLSAVKIVAASQLKTNDPRGALQTLAPSLATHANDSKLLSLAGEAYLMARDYNKAMHYLDRAAELSPDDAGIRTRQAAIHLATGDRKEALSDLEKAASLNEKAGQADLALVMLLLKDKEFDKALAAIAKLETKLPNNPVTHNIRAIALLGKQDRPGARKELLQALTIQPSFTPAAIKLAQMDLQDKQPDAARKRFEAVLAADKNNVQAMLAMAELASAKQNEKDYLHWLEKAAKTDPTSLKAQSGLIRYYIARKENAKALAQAKLAVSANPENLEGLRLLGATQLGTGDKEAAIAAFTQITQRAPQSPEAYRLLATAQNANKQINAARDSLKTALRLNPEDVKTLDALVRLELANKAPESALAIARQIQSQHPKSPHGFDIEGAIEMSQKHFPKATKAYEQAVARGAGTEGMIKLHRSLIAAGDVKSADRQLIIWIKQQPKDIAARNYAAEHYMTSNRNREAITQFEEVRKATPNNFTVLNNLANLYQREKDGQRALASAEHAYKLAQEHPAVLDTLGWILLEQNQLPRALDLLRNAAHKAPTASVIRYHYGAALVRSGRRAEARKELEAAIAGKQSFQELAEAQALLKGL